MLRGGEKWTRQRAEPMFEEIRRNVRRRYASLKSAKQMIMAHNENAPDGSYGMCCTAVMSRYDYCYPWIGSKLDK